MMKEQVKLRLLITFAVIVMGVLYVAPFVLNANVNEQRQQTLDACIKKSGPSFFDSCWRESRQVTPGIGHYAFPVLPAAAIMWFIWLLGFDAKLSEGAYPRRTVQALLWIGMLAAVGGIAHHLWYVASLDLSALQLWEAISPLWIAACWLISPLVFQHLLGPAGTSVSVRKGKIMLLIAAITPVLGLIVFLVRVGLQDLAARS